MPSSFQLLRSSALVLSLALVTACDESFTGPTYPLDSRFTLAPGETAGIERAGIRVQFHAVEGDSRCPADVVCIQGGDALVRISVLSSDGQRDYELHTGDMQPVRHDELTIALEELAPYPFSSRTIEPDDYRATLRVTR
jgi:hypothetical protein